MGKKLGRREFIKRAAQTAAVAAVFPAGVFGSARKKPVVGGSLPVRALGKTGENLPVLGFGSVELAKAWGATLPYDERVKIVRHAYERGLRYFDTAGNYQEAQSILGEGIKDVRRRVHLVSRVETTHPKMVRRGVEKTMKALKTDYLDTIHIHGTPGIEHMTVERAMQVHAELVKLKAQGLVRFIGFSAHSYFDKAYALIDSGGFDQCMLAYGYISRGHDQLHSDKMIALRDKCLARARELGMGLVAMKVMGAALFGAWAPWIAPELGKERLRQLPGAAVRHVLADERVHILNIGMASKKDVDANVDLLSGDTTYTEEDRVLLAEFTAKAREKKPMNEMRVE